MKIIKTSSLSFIPTSHDDPQNPGALKKILVKYPDIEPGKLQMINWSRLLPNKAFEKHYHEDMDEIFIMLNGQVDISIAGEASVLEAGDTVIVPKGAIHCMRNLTNQPIDYIAIGISHGTSGKTIVVA